MSTTEQDQVAILVANVVGYERLRQSKGAAANDRLDEALRTVVEIVGEHGGRLFTGKDDAALEVALPSALDATKAAIAIQDAQAKHNANLPAIEHLSYGIGIDFGHASIEGQGLAGDAAVLARGLTKRTRPGTTLVTKAVFQRIQPHLHFSYHPRREPFIPGSSGPVETYQIKTAPPEAGGVRMRRDDQPMRRVVRSMRRATAKLRSLAEVDFRKPALATPAWLVAAGLTVIVVGVIAKVGYDRLTATPEGLAVATTADETSLETAGRAASEAEPKPARPAPAAAGPVGDGQAEVPTEPRRAEADETSPPLAARAAAAPSPARDQQDGPAAASGMAATVASGTAATGASRTTATDASGTAATGASGTAATGESGTAATGESGTAATGESGTAVTGESGTAATVERGSSLRSLVAALEAPPLPAAEPGAGAAAGIGRSAATGQPQAAIEPAAATTAPPTPIRAEWVAAATPAEHDAEPAIGPEPTAVTRPFLAEEGDQGADGGLSGTEGEPAPNRPAAEVETAATAPDGPADEGDGLTVTGALAALRAMLFQEPEPAGDELAEPAPKDAELAEPAPKDAELAAAPPPEASSGGDHHPEAEQEVQTARLTTDVASDDPAPEQRSIVVLPFANPSGEPARDYFSDGVTETLTSSLTRFPHLKVIANESAAGYRDGRADPAEIGKELGVRYILEGTATRTNDDLVVTAQLIDTTTSDAVWDEMYRAESSDPSAAQRTLIQRVLLSLEGRDPKSTPAGGPGVEPVGTVSLEAYDYTLQWRSLFDKFREADNVRAREAALRAVELDPGYAAAHAFVAWTYMADYWWGWSNDPSETLEPALLWATRGLDQDARDYNAHWALGDVYQAMGEHDKAVAAYETALAINPEVAGLLEDFGTWMLPLRGRAEEGAALAQKAMRLNPHHPESYYGDIAFNYYLLGDYDDAVRSVTRIAEPRLDHRLYLAASYAQTQRPEEARLQIAKVHEEHENLTVEQFLATFPFKYEADREHLREGLEKAGLPAEPVN